MSRLCPVIYPACAEHKKAQAAPNSTAVPNRLAGTLAIRSVLAASTEMPRFLAVIAMFEASRSVSKAPRRTRVVVHQNVGLGAGAEQRRVSRGRSDVGYHR